MKPAFAILVVSAALFVSITHALYSRDDDVIELTTSNFDRMVINDNSAWVVEFYLPSCEYCQALVPEYKKLAKMLNGYVKVGAVDVDVYKTFRDQYEIPLVPTIMIFGVNKRSPIKYDGERTANAIAMTLFVEVVKSGYTRS